MSARRTKNFLADKPRAYRQLWRVVDGAVFDALYTHEDYLTAKGRRSARTSINKRVVGAVMGFASQTAKGRSGESPAADRVADSCRSPSRAAVSLAVSKWRAALQGVARVFTRAQS